VYKNAKNGPDGIVTEVAKWRQSRHFVPKSAALTGPKMHGVEAHFLDIPHQNKSSENDTSTTQCNNSFIEVFNFKLYQFIILLLPSLKWLSTKCHCSRQ